MRIDAVPVEEAYLKRLVEFRARQEPQAANRRRRTRRPATAAFFGKLQRMANICGQTLTLLPAMLRQSSTLRNAPRGREPLVLAIASNRIPLSIHEPSPRANLCRLARPLGISDHGAIASKIMSAERVYLFDPLPISRYWEKHGECAAEGIVIADAVFLAVHGLMTAFNRSGTPRLLEYYREARRIGKGRRLSLTQALFCRVFIGSYASTLAGWPEYEAAFFTFNSTLTELLRGYLISDNRCCRILEIMHGVGERIGERYFATILDEGRIYSTTTKHFFVPQIPILPLFGAFGAYRVPDSRLAINAYLNRYFVEQLGLHGSADRFIDNELQHIFGADGQMKRPLVITIFGNYSSEGSDLGSASFEAERYLIQLVDDLLRARASNAKLIYVPHPSHPLSLFSGKVFGQAEVIIYPKSIFCWLVSDVCLSLLSSAMFEAAYFGSRSFTPLRAADGLFPESYMQLLTTPADATIKSLDQALSNLIIAADDEPRETLLGRARLRIGRMTTEAA